MDLGVISVRYARALLKCCAETHAEEQVYREMQALAESYIKVPELRRAVDNPMTDRTAKAALLKAAAGGEVSDVTVRLIALVVKEGRETAMQFIANSYVTLYRRRRNIICGKLTTAVPVSADIERKMRGMVEARANGTVEFASEVVPEILGGFILEYGTYRLDASAKTQLNRILKELKQNTTCQTK